MPLLRARHLARLLVASQKRLVDHAAVSLPGRHSSSAAVSTEGKKWNLFSSVCLERRPVISAEPTEIEARMLEMISKLEFEGSLKSDHELRREKDKDTMEALKAGNASEADLEQATKATAQEFEDLSLDEITNFTFAPLKNEKIDGDLKSLDRLMRDHLVLLVKQKVGDENLWLMPQTLRLDGETMREAAERGLADAAGPKLDSLVLGNAPVGFYKYHYPKEVREKVGAQGAKVFFYKALYKGGEIASKDHAWVSKQELEKKVHKNYYNSVDQFLFY